jgi:hypothetical protein
MRLDPQRFLFIGTPSEAIPVPNSKFLDAFNVMDFQLVAWNAETLLPKYKRRQAYLFKAIITRLSIGDLRHYTKRE